MKPRPTPTGFDRIIVVVCTGLVLLFGAVSLVGCNPKARQCRKAEAKLTDAIHLCPEIMLPQVKMDTIVLYTKPEATAGERLYNQASMDSLLVYCAALRQGNTDTVEIIRRIIRNTCQFDAVTEATDKHLLKIWSEGGKVRYWINDLPQKVQTVTQYVYRDITKGNVEPKQRVKSWFWIGLLLGLIVGVFLSLFIRGGNKHQDYTPHLKNPME